MVFCHANKLWQFDCFINCVTLSGHAPQHNLIIFGRREYACPVERIDTLGNVVVPNKHFLRSANLNDGTSSAIGCAYGSGLQLYP